MNVIMLAVTLVGAIGAGDADRTPLVQQALDQVMQFEIEDTPVLDAFEALTEATGLEFRVVEGVTEHLPYGADTKVSVVLRNISLREGLPQFLSPLGMTFDADGTAVYIRPGRVLLRLGRRATWAELDGLAFVHEIDWPAVVEKTDGIRGRFQFRVAGIDPWEQLLGAITRIGAGSGEQILTLACESYGWTWVPEGDAIVVLPKIDQVRRQLARSVSMRVTHRSLVEVLRRLGREANVTIGHEPGVLASLPPQTRENFSLLVEGVTAEEALEQIAAATGLGYRVGPDAVVFYHPGGVPAAASRGGGVAARRSDPYLAKLCLPAEPGEIQVEILIRQSELSPEAIEARRRLVARADEILRLELQAQSEE